MTDESPIRCVVAEDYPELNRIYTSILNHEPEITVLASLHSGAELLAFVEQEQPDVVLLDIEMEEPTAGITCCREMHRRFPDIRVVFLTCHDEEERILSAFEAGAIDYIRKTESMTEIIAAVRRAGGRDAPIHSYAAETLRRHMQKAGQYKEELQRFTQIFMTLSPAEVGILQLLLQGYKQREIAQMKHIEVVTVKSHVGRILKKFQLRRTSTIVGLIRELDAQDLVAQARSI
ncbi:LuxR family transcriptional regulator [Alkalispirochaeta sphaeroplastigenens]|uniref:LuxR family transcriptional regulator n=1 Tax=Alkalispirochaeta sphaeroplastigenens TaxID=1187066 RepID=A0A2S4JJD3_9SPIO|nr:response regulator transcription factor [Alkalispirochaeta sphaeroplastigenens]POQ99654.1 LuxR family transcriptional regulator [Alkalispirochaeta sphaeroplastigenens]